MHDLRAKSAKAGRRNTVQAPTRPDNSLRFHPADRVVFSNASTLENFMIHWAEGLSPKEFKEQLRWFAKDVMPALKRA